MNYDFVYPSEYNLNEICANCGGRRGLHNHKNQACPKDINAGAEHTEYVFGSSFKSAKEKEASTQPVEGEQDDDKNHATAVASFESCMKSNYFENHLLPPLQKVWDRKPETLVAIVRSIYIAGYANAFNDQQPTSALPDKQEGEGCRTVADLIEKAAEQEIKNYQPNNEYPTYYHESNMIDMFNAGSIFAFNYIKKQNSKETGQREAIAVLIVKKIGEYVNGLDRRNLGVPMMDEVAVMQMETMVEQILENPSGNVEVPEYY